jgi:SAM-dependent methyltransferase
MTTGFTQGQSMTAAGTGYVTDVRYTRTFNRDLAPAWLDLTALVSGFEPPDRRGGFAWCELGCGQGVSAAVLAATHPEGVFHAIDLAPGHLETARLLARRAGAGNLSLHAADFADAASLGLPRFDYIVADGVYSWIDDPVRAQFRAFIDRHLAPGGLVYLSYNAMPGWAADLPLRHMLAALADDAAGDSATRFAAAEQTIRRLVEAGAAALKDGPIVKSLLDKFGKQLPWGYLIHEFLPRGWRAFYVTELRADMAGIGLRPVGSAALAENFDPFVLRPADCEALDELTNPDLRELARDYFTNNRFRRDVFARAADCRGAGDWRERLRDCVFALARPPALVEYVAASPAVSVRFDNPAAHALVAGLADGPRRLRDIPPGAVEPDGIVKNALALCCADIIRAVGPGWAPVAALNTALLDLEDGAAQARFYLALPCGTALALEPDLLPALRDGTPPPENLAPWLDFLRPHLWG